MGCVCSCSLALSCQALPMFNTAVSLPPPRFFCSWPRCMQGPRRQSSGVSSCSCSWRPSHSALVERHHNTSTSTSTSTKRPRDPSLRLRACACAYWYVSIDQPLSLSRPLLLFSTENVLCIDFAFAVNQCHKQTNEQQKKKKSKG